MKGRAAPGLGLPDLFDACLPAAGASLRGQLPRRDIGEAPGADSVARRFLRQPSGLAARTLFRMRAERTLRPVFADCSSRPAGIGQDQDKRRNPPEEMCAPQRIARSALGGRRRRSNDAGWLENRFDHLFLIICAREASVGRTRASEADPPSSAGEAPFHSRSTPFKYFLESPASRFAFRGTQCDPGRLEDSGPAACNADVGGPPGSAPTHGDSRHLPTSAAAARSGLLRLFPPRARIGLSTPRLETVKPDAGYERRVFPSEPSCGRSISGASISESSPFMMINGCISGFLNLKR